MGLLVLEVEDVPPSLVGQVGLSHVLVSPVMYTLMIAEGIRWSLTR